MTTYWTAENRPEDHPLWAEQVQMERRMLTTGAESYRAVVEKHRSKNSMSDLKPQQRLIKEFIQPFAEAIQGWRDSYSVTPWEELGISRATWFRRGKPVPPSGNVSESRGARPEALGLLSTVPSDVLALLTLRVVLDRMAAEKVNVAVVALAIGMTAEHEARINAWQAHDQELWNSLRDELEADGEKVRQSDIRRAMSETGHLTFAQLQEKITQQKATSTHRRRVNINKFNRSVRSEIGWADWSHKQRQHVGFAMIDLLVRVTGRFTITVDPDWKANVYVKGKKTGSKKNPMRPRVLMMSAELQEWLSASLEREELFHPFYMPTLIPPRDWEGLRDGGYHTDLLPQRIMIRFKADHEEQRRRAVSDMSNVDMPDVYAALNAVQGVPWRINEAVYTVAMAAWAKDLQLAKMPRKQPFPDAYRSPDIPPRGEPMTEEQEALLKDWKRKQTDIEGKNARLGAKVFKTNRVLDTAALFLDRDFYFPHVLDFRGRMYPIPVELNPQGEDLARGLLTFAEGKPLTEEGAEWLAIQVCNTFGNDKVPFEDRMQWTLDREELWRRIAEDPLGNREWAAKEVSEPWQHLAAIFEWARYLDEGLGMITTLPVRVDGTCNGIQHLSAMIRDEDGGASVNLTPGDRPRDIYKEVAVLVLAELERIASQDEDTLDNAEDLARHDSAVFWLNALGNDVPRSLTKRPVMILPYGGTREAYFKYTMKWLNEEDPEKERFPDDRRYKLARFMTNLMWGIIREKLKRAVSVQEWLQAVAKIASTADGAPLKWFTPVGFLVRHFYGTRKEVQIQTKIDGRRVDLVNWEMTAELSLKDQLQGIAPNFTHAMDAATLMESILLAADYGVTSVTTIHDAYGAVASDIPVLNACLRRAFVTLYTDFDPLGDFLAACEDLVRTHRRAVNSNEYVKWPNRPEAGTLDLDQVIESAYFFA